MKEQQLIEVVKQNLHLFHSQCRIRANQGHFDTNKQKDNSRLQEKYKDNKVLQNLKIDLWKVNQRLNSQQNDNNDFINNFIPYNYPHVQTYQRREIWKKGPNINNKDKNLLLTQNQPNKTISYSANKANLTSKIPYNQYNQINNHQMNNNQPNRLFSTVKNYQPFATLKRDSSHRRKTHHHLFNQLQSEKNNQSRKTNGSRRRYKIFSLTKNKQIKATDKQIHINSINLQDQQNSKKQDRIRKQTRHSQQYQDEKQNKNIYANNNPQQQQKKGLQGLEKVTTQVLIHKKQTQNNMFNIPRYVDKGPNQQQKHKITSIYEIKDEEYLPSPDELNTILKKFNNHHKIPPPNQIRSTKNQKPIPNYHINPNKRINHLLRYHDSKSVYESIPNNTKQYRQTFIPPHPDNFIPNNIIYEDFNNKMVKKNHKNQSYGNSNFGDWNNKVKWHYNNGNQAQEQINKR